MPSPTLEVPVPDENYCIAFLVACLSKMVVDRIVMRTIPGSDTTTVVPQLIKIGLDDKAESMPRFEASRRLPQKFKWGGQDDFEIGLRAQ